MKWKLFVNALNFVDWRLKDKIKYWITPLELFSHKSTKFSAFTNSFLVLFIPTSRFYRTDLWGLWSDGQTHCETFVFRISKHYMILSVRRILEATYVMKVKLFIRSHGLKNWVMRVKWLLRNTGTLWCNQLTLSNLFSSSVRNCLSSHVHIFHSIFKSPYPSFRNGLIV